MGCLLLALALLALSLGIEGTINPSFYGCSHGVTYDYSLALFGFTMGALLPANAWRQLRQR